MKILRPMLLALALAASFATVGVFGQASAATKEDLNRQADEALQKLITTNPDAAAIAKQAKAELIFPNIVKAGLVFGGSYGEGVLKVGSNVDGYYNSVTGSWGLQAGAQSYGYVLFLMNEKALDYLRSTHGWEIGTGPSVVVANAGIGKSLTSTSLKDDVYAFIFNQQGLMAGVSIEGTKVSRINPTS